MYHQQSEELPHDLVLSIRRILDLKDLPDTDPLGDGFNVIDVINGYFPDGTFMLEATTTGLPKVPCYFSRGIAWAIRYGTSAASAR